MDSSDRMCTHVLSCLLVTSHVHSCPQQPPIYTSNDLHISRDLMCEGEGRGGVGGNLILVEDIKTRKLGDDTGGKMGWMCHCPLRPLLPCPAHKWCSWRAPHHRLALRDEGGQRRLFEPPTCTNHKGLSIRHCEQRTVNNGL